MRIYDLLYIAAVASSLAIGPRDKELGGDGSKHRMALALQLNSKDGVRSDIVSAFDDQKEGGIRFDFSEIGQTRSKRSEQETPIVESDSSPAQADANAEVGGLSDMFWQLLLIAKQITIEKVTILKDILSMLDKIKSIQDGMSGNDDGAGNIIDEMGVLAVSSLNAASVLHEKEVAVQARKLQGTDSAKKLSDYARLQSLVEEKDREDKEEEEEEWKVLHNGKNKRAEAPTIEKDHIHDEECDLSEHLKDENEEDDDDDDDEKKEDEDDSSGEETKGMKSKLKKLMMKKMMKMKKMKMKEKEKEEEKSNDDMVDDKGADNVDYESDDECEEEEPKKAGKLAGLKAKFSKSKKPFDKEEDEEDEEEKKVDEDCASDFAGEIQEPIDSAEECKDGANDDEKVCEGDIDGKDEKEEEVCDDGEDGDAGDKKTSMISKLKGMMKKKKKTSSENDNLKEEPDCEVEEEESQEETPKKGGKIAGIKAKFLKLKKPSEGEQEDEEQDEEKGEGEEDTTKIDCKDAKSKDNEKRKILHIKGKMYKRGDSILERHYDLSHLFKDDIPKLSLKALQAEAGNPKQPPGQLINSANGDA